ncbi:MAG: hypothetical protein V2A63_03900 [Patescibacteria group bacterium]
MNPSGDRLVKKHGWIFLIPKAFLEKQDSYYKQVLSKNKTWLESYSAHKRRFQKSPLLANKAHPLKHKLQDFWSSECCSGKRKGDRVVFFLIAKNVIYLVDILPGHCYKEFETIGAKNYPKNFRDAIKLESIRKLRERGLII